MAAFYVAAMVLVAIWALVDGNPLLNRGVVMLVVGVSGVSVPAIGLGFRRLPRGAFLALGAGAAAAVGAVMVAGGQPFPVALLVLWPLPYVVAIYRPRQVVLHLSVIGVVYVGALIGIHLRLDHRLGFGAEDALNWTFLMLSAIALTVFVMRMRRALSASSADLRKKAAQQAAVAHLGATALETTDPVELLDEAVELVQTVLAVDLTTVLESLEDRRELLARAGRGWPERMIGFHSVGTDEQTQAGWCLVHGGLVVAEDFRREARFGLSDVLHARGVRSGVAVRIEGRGAPFGVLAVHTLRKRRFSDDETNFLQAIAHVLAAAIGRQRTEDEIHYQALHDPLTGLPNRLLFKDRLRHALARSGRDGAPVAVLFLDLDNFKVINDSLGHEAGDAVLVQLAPRLAESVRSGDTVARFGGDEFVLLCEDLSGEEEALEIAQRVQSCFERPFAIGGSEHLAAASIGLALGAAGADTPDELIADADAAMYHAKRHGRARCERFEPTMRRNAQERLRTEAELRHALENDELRLYYQPVVNLAGGRIVAVEALVRWQHPERGLVAPVEFIPIAEESGLIVPLGDWVLREALRMAAYWRRLRPAPAPPVVVSVNVSARQMAEPGLVPRVAQVLSEAGVDPSQLALEITESMLIEDPLASADVLSALRALGVRMVLDDFGTGYSSFNYIKHFPVDFLKLDRSFVVELTAGSTDVAIVNAVVEMARALDTRVVAEGVETDAQLDEVIRLGCDLAQGFYFARPVPPERVDDLLMVDPWRSPNGHDVTRKPHPVAGWSAWSSW